MNQLGPRLSRRNGWLNRSAVLLFAVATGLACSSSSVDDDGADGTDGGSTATSGSGAAKDSGAGTGTRTDSGATKVDSGTTTTATDSGTTTTPTTDSGTSTTTTPDSGTTARDSGTTAVDSGTTARDSGTTVVDSGVAKDSGTTVVDSGTTVRDSGTTVVDSGTTTTPPSCTWGTPFNANASFTFYTFGQGTSHAPDGNFLTACGYEGTESGTTDTVINVANTSPAKNTYFAAIPGSNNFNTVNDCGACVEITNGGTKIVATVVDECPTDNGQNPACTMTGHLDLSESAFQALGYPVGNPSNTTWKFVACPVTGNITTVAKQGNKDMVYIQNGVYPITGVTVNGQAATHLSYGPWQLPGGLTAAGATLTIASSVVNQTLTITVPGGFGDTQKQFPEPQGCF